MVGHPLITIIRAYCESIKENPRKVKEMVNYAYLLEIDTKFLIIPKSLGKLSDIKNAKSTLTKF